MLRVITLQKGKYIVETKTDILHVRHEENKIWLTKDEIALLFRINKNEIKKELHKLITNSELELLEGVKKVYNTDILKYDTYYSLDVLIILGYKLKEFDKTKLLISINRGLKAYISQVAGSPLTKYKQRILSKLANYIHTLNQNTITY